MENKRFIIVYLIDFLESKSGLAGGTERQLIELLSRIDKRKFRPILCYLRDNSDNIQIRTQNFEKFNLNIHSLLSLKCLSKLIRFIKFLKSNKVDIVQTFFFDATLFGVLGAKLSGINNVISCRRDLGFWYNKKLLILLRIANLFTKKILVNSEAIKKKIKNIENIKENKIDVIYNGIDIKTINNIEAIRIRNEFSQIKPADKIVGIVANLNRKVKRVDIFIKAASEIVKRFHNVKFLIIGDGSLKNKLKSLAIETKLEKFLIFMGRRRNAIPYIKSFDIGVLTSDSEGFSNVLLEYMACRVPVVASGVGGNCELIENNRTGILVQPGNYLEFSEKIMMLLKNKEKRLALSKSAFNSIFKKYDWKMKIIDYEDYYQNLIKMRNVSTKKVTSNNAV